MSALTPHTISRRFATPQFRQHMIDMFSSVLLEADAADMLEAFGNALKGSAYSEYGSVDLLAAAETMREEYEAFTSPQTCNSCGGSGEGQYEGSNCFSCKGAGEHPSRESAERRAEAAEYYADSRRDAAMERAA